MLNPILCVLCLQQIVYLLLDQYQSCGLYFIVFTCLFMFKLHNHKLYCWLLQFHLHMTLLCYYSLIILCQGKWYTLMSEITGMLGYLTKMVCSSVVQYKMAYLSVRGNGILVCQCKMAYLGVKGNGILVCQCKMAYFGVRGNYILLCQSKIACLGVRGKGYTCVLKC